jgi:hypothetical protein
MRLTLILFTCLLGSKIFAQLATLSAGGDFAAEQGSVSFSIGETISNAVELNDSYIIQQGVQQPFYSSDKHELRTESYELEVFPNPAATKLSVLLKNSESTEQEIGFEILTLDGRRCLNGKINNLELNVLEINNLVDGMYFLRLKTPQQEQIKFSKIDTTF